MDSMKKTVLLKSLSTGLVGLYPESHLNLDPDLVLADDTTDGFCADCVAPVVLEPDFNIDDEEVTNG